MRFPRYAACCVLSAVVTACGGDTGTGSQAPTLASRYFGTEALGAATCTPAGQSLPSEFDPRAVTIPHLVDVTQASEQVSTSYVDLPGVRASGTIDADGSVELTGSRTFEYAGGYPAKYEFTLALATQNGGERLRGTGTWTVQGRPRPDGSAEVTCTRPMTLDYVSHTKPLVELSALSCSQEATLRPQPSGTLSLIRFRNARSTDALGVSVIDDQGRRAPIGTLEPGREGWVWSFVTIPWVITDASGACVAVYMPRAEPATATLR